MGKWPDFEYHGGKRLKYDQFVFLKKKRPILGHPNNDAYDEMNPPFLI